MATGRVILVGAGPGDPSLITVKALAALHRADVVVYDRLASEDLLSHAPRHAELIDVGKAPGDQRVTQEEINRILVREAEAGKTVVRLKGGDPFVFGRGGEEALAMLEAGVPCEVVPGVTAGIAAPACAGIPVTHRETASCVTFVTGHEDPTKPESGIHWKALAQTGGTLVFYMGVKQLSNIVNDLTAAGLSADTPAACIERGTTIAQRSVRGKLGDIAQKVSEAGIHPPAITVVGAVAGLPEELNWFERRPLFGRRIVVTRPRDQAVDMAEELAALGAEIILLPAVEVAPPSSWGEVDNVIGRLESFDWVIFTSANAVWMFMGRLAELGRDSRALGRTRVASVGTATREPLLQNGIRPDLIPEDFVSAAVVADLARKGGLRGKHVLLARSDIAPKDLPDALIALGAEVTEVTLYRTQTNTSPDPHAVQAVRRGECDLVTFTSSSTVKGFVEIIGTEAVGKLKGSVQFASIGPVTTATALELGIPITIEAERHTAEGLVKAILDKSRPA